MKTPSIQRWSAPHDFATQAALTALWHSVGVRPNAVLGRWASASSAAANGGGRIGSGGRRPASHGSGQPRCRAAEDSGRPAIERRWSAAYWDEPCSPPTIWARLTGEGSRAQLRHGRSASSRWPTPALTWWLSLAPLRTRWRHCGRVTNRRCGPPRSWRRWGVPGDRTQTLQEGSRRPLRRPTRPAHRSPSRGSSRASPDAGSPYQAIPSSAGASGSSVQIRSRQHESYANQ